MRVLQILIVLLRAPIVNRCALDALDHDKSALISLDELNTTDHNNTARTRNIITITTLRALIQNTADDIHIGSSTRPDRVAGGAHVGAQDCAGVGDTPANSGGERPFHFNKTFSMRKCLREVDIATRGAKMKLLRIANSITDQIITSTYTPIHRM